MANAAAFNWNGTGNGANEHDFDAKQNWIDPDGKHMPKTVSGDTDLHFGAVDEGDSTTPVVNFSISVNKIVFDPSAVGFELSGPGALVLNNGIYNNSGSEQIVNTSIAGSGGVFQNSGTLTLSGDNSYTGPTTVTGGTLNIDSSTGLGQTLGLNLAGGIVNLNTTVMLPAPVFMRGGTMNVNAGLSRFGPLEIGLGTSTINLGTSGRITFDGISSAEGQLIINGWTGGVPGPQIFITGTADPDLLSHIVFAGYPGGILITSSGELAPVPEPGVYTALFGAGLLVFASARRFRKTAKARS